MNTYLIYDLGNHRVAVEFQAVSTLLIFGQAATWQWLSGQRWSRQNTFFGVRVDPTFVRSEVGRAIVRKFKLLLWSWTTIVAIVYVIATTTNNWSEMGMSYWLLGGLVAVMLGYQFAFSIASRETRAKGTLLSEPSTRTAVLFSEEDQVSPWLTLLDWLGILLPVGLPLVTIGFLTLHRNQFTSSNDLKDDLFAVIFTGFVGILPAATQFALRYHARSSDWAPNPGASRRYRTFLGITQASVFTLMILQMCVLSLVRRVALFPDMKTYFRFAYFGYFIVLPFVLTMRFWLKKNLSRESGDPMADHYWKWGWFYHNPDDPALIVPMRTGFGYSFNYARPSVWLSAALVTVAVVVGLAHFTQIV